MARLGADSVLGVLLLVLLVPSYAQASTTLVDNAHRMIAWVQGMESGYVNMDIQTLRPLYGKDGDPLSLFAATDIKQGTLLAVVPWESIIAEVVTDEDLEMSVLACKTAFRLDAELANAEASFYEPYLSYLMALSPEQMSIPSTWTDQGKQLFLEVLADGQIHSESLPPTEAMDWITKDWIKDCGGAAEQTFAATAVISRADGPLLIPVMDLYTHRNGRHLNTKQTIHDGKSYTVTAKRNIKAGEPLHTSQNMCDNCGPRQASYGTPDILRDYGIVEDYPQRWNFEEREIQFDIEEDGVDENGKNKFKINWSEGMLKIPFLTKQLRRLAKLRSNSLQPGREAWTKTSDFDYYVDGQMPQHEWDTVTRFVDSAILAFSNAIKSITGENIGCLNEVNDACSSIFLYHDLNDEEDDVYYNFETCDMDAMLAFTDYEDVDFIQTTYQSMTYAKRTKGENPDGNMCMDLDDTVQICDNYRPHYHEYGVHYGARYVDSVKRVAFIGGGDSMVLHEVLKYPDLELVIGLELDQQVLRTGFKWFNTQPHFDDDRVEWWFGDATKSLMLLPREYANSFDIVVVDLSETATSLSVTEHLDIFDAMALLVKPDGVLLKNELYFEKMSKAMDYSVEFHFYDCPMICDQSMIMGSNHIDFFNKKLTDHGVETLLLPDIRDYPNPFFLFHDYSANDPTEDGMCEKMDDAIQHQANQLGRRQGKSEGMLMVIEIEACTIHMRDMTAQIVETLEHEGFIIHTDDDFGDSKFESIVVMQEGYIIARKWPKYKYVAMDIYLWGRFDLMESVREALIKALGAGNHIKKGSVSSYRIVVSGVHGSDSWEKDLMLMGPDLNHNTRRCNVTETEQVPDGVSVTSSPIAPTFLTESLSTIYDAMVKPDKIALVFCGPETEVCPAYTATRASNKFARVLPLYECFSLVANSSDTAIRHRCRQQLIDQARNAVADSGLSIFAAVLDIGASKTMAQIFLSFWVHRRNSIQEDVVHLFISMMPNANEDTWRRNVLEQIRKSILLDLVARVELLVDSQVAPSAEIGILTIDQDDTFAMVKNAADVLTSKHPDLDIHPHRIKGGANLFQEPTLFNPREFVAADYDIHPAQQQFQDQLPLGRQVVFQLERPASTTAPKPNFLSIMSGWMKFLRLQHEGIGFLRLGEGAMANTRFQGGHAAVLWDGREHMTLNLFLVNQTKAKADEFLAAFLIMAEGGWAQQLRDDFPRGINRVINFEMDFTDADKARTAIGNSGHIVKTHDEL